MMILQGEITRALDTLFGDSEARTLTPDRVRRVMNDLAHYVVQETEHGVLFSLLTTQDVAERLDISERRVRARAKWLNERGQPVGWRVPGTVQWLFLPREVESIRGGKGGRPRKTG
jgi:hypothetical protein